MKMIFLVRVSALLQGRRSSEIQDISILVELVVTCWVTVSLCRISGKSLICAKALAIFLEPLALGRYVQRGGRTWEHSHNIRASKQHFKPGFYGNKK